MRVASVMLAASLAGSTPVAPRMAPDQSGLPVLGPAPGFTLRAQDGAEVALDQFRGKAAVAVTFIFASCSATCPILTSKMATVQDRLGTDFGSKIVFLSITVDPEHDTPDVLRRYAQAFDADPKGWKFLTGSPQAIRDLEKRYGVFVAPAAENGVDHTNLTSLVDPRGMLRVQYLGVRFDPDEFRRDLLSLVEKP
ncbi:MAG: SCO family protein [Acetobacteraceae bacterium]|nr:SCO family protein [Acetobacteraceae bacterium]